MLNQQQFEHIVKSSLVNKAEKIDPSDSMFENIKHGIQLDKSKKRFNLKEKFLPLSLNLKKSIVTAICGIFVITGTILSISPSIRASAFQIIDKHVGGYLTTKNYDKIPSKDKIKEDLGYDAKIPSSLSGGYKLVDSSINSYIDGSETPDKQSNKKGAGALYSKHIISQESISLNICKVEAKADSPIFKNAKTVTVGNTAAYWTEYERHVVPINTFNKMSKQEKDKIDEACKNGKAVVSVIGGSGKEKIKTAHTLKWADNNVSYRLTDLNNELTFKEMVKIAENIINSD